MMRQLFNFINYFRATKQNSKSLAAVNKNCNQRRLASWMDTWNVHVTLHDYRFVESSRGRAHPSFEKQMKITSDTKQFLCDVASEDGSLMNATLQKIIRIVSEIQLTAQKCRW